MSERADNVRFFYFQDPEHVRPWQLWGAGMTERERVAYFSGLNFREYPHNSYGQKYDTFT